MPYVARAKEDAARAQRHREALEALKDLTAPGDVVFSNSGDLGVRHIAQRGLFLTFKDGYHPYYNKNLDQARQWLANEKLRTQSPTGYVDVAELRLALAYLRQARRPRHAGKVWAGGGKIPVGLLCAGRLTFPRLHPRLHLTFSQLS